MPGFFEKKEQHRQISGQNRQKHVQIAIDLTNFKKTDDSVKYQGLTSEGTVLGWITERDAVHRGTLDTDAEVGVILDQTTFYAEQGGQVADTGFVCLCGNRLLHASGVGRGFERLVHSRF